MRPKVVEMFELTLEDSHCDPMDMVKNFGYDPKGWKYNGKKVKGGETYKCKLVQVGRCNNMQKAVKKLKKLGEIPPGQLLQAFKEKKYFEADGPVGITDASWVDPDGCAGFPCVVFGGRLYFSWADRGLDDRWRFLVLCK